MSTTISDSRDALKITPTADQQDTNADRSSNGPARFELPDEPLITIEPSKSWGAINLRELWQHRELLYFLTWRDVKVRYKQTALGVAWAIMQPLFTMLVFSVVFGRLARIPSDNIPYPLFAYAGLLPWIFFSNSVVSCSNSIVNSAHLITKVYFPRIIVPIASIGASLVDFVVSMGLLALLMVYYRVTPTWHLVMFVPMVILTALFVLGLGFWLAALNVKYRDIRFAIPFVIQLWMFLSPIIYPLSLLPEKWGRFLALNPLTGIIEGYRSALFGTPFKWSQMGISLAVALILLIYSSYVFRKMEKSFADIV